MTTLSPLIKLLHPSTAKPQASALEGCLKGRYATLDVVCVDYDEVTQANLDDITGSNLLMVIFDGSMFPDVVLKAIAAFRNTHGDFGWVLPIASNRGYRDPPAPLSGVNAGALFGPAKEELAAIVERTGALLGLWLRGGTKKIFISYRAIDADAIAKQLHSHLTRQGFRVWQDKSPDEYDQPHIKIGEDVQQRIRECTSSDQLGQFAPPN